jgi:hypothetical protein
MWQFVIFPVKYLAYLEYSYFRLPNVNSINLPSQFPLEIQAAYPTNFTLLRGKPRVYEFMSKAKAFFRM